MTAATTPQFERVHAVEDTHWWFVGLRELVVSTIASLLPDGGRVLDAGCGTGRVLADLPVRYERVGVDVNPDVLALARRRPGLELHAATLERLPFEDDSFDAVFSLDVISDARLADPAAALRELRRVLRAGAPLILNVPAYELLRSGHDVAAQTGRRFTANRIRRELVEAGLQPTRVGYRMTALLPVAIVRRVLRRRRVATEVGAVNPTVNRVLTAVVRLENRVVLRVPLPVGLSIFAIARKVHS
jgi:SAM-dependent methyltransferase